MVPLQSPPASETPSSTDLGTTLAVPPEYSALFKVVAEYLVPHFSPNTASSISLENFAYILDSKFFINFA